MAASASAWNASPGCGSPVRPSTSTGVDGGRHLDRLAAVVDERAHAAHDRAGDERVADAQRAVLHEDGRHGTAAAIELRLEHGARRVPLRIGLVLADVADEQNHLEQRVEPGLLLRRDGHHDGLAAPVFRHEIQIGELALDALGIGAWLVDLVDRHDDRHVRRLRVIDRLARLRHHAVVGRDDQHDDVGDLRAARAHQRERLVARRVEEHDVPSGVGRDVIGADVLRNAAGFALGDARRADRVEQRGLAVVDVSHDRDDGRARDGVFRLHVFRFHFEHVLLERAELQLGAELARDHRRGVGVDVAVDRHHQPLVEQLLQHVLHALFELVGEILHRHAFDEGNGPRDGRRRHLRLLLRALFAALVAFGAPADGRPHRRRRESRRAGPLLADAA